MIGLRNGRANSADIFRAFCPAKGTSRVRSSALDFSLSGHEDDAEPAFCLPAGWRTDPGCNSESRFDKAHKQKEGSRKAIPRGSLFYRNREALVFTHPGSPLCMPTSVRYDYLKKVNMESKCLSEKLLLHFCPHVEPGRQDRPWLVGLVGPTPASFQKLPRLPTSLWACFFLLGANLFQPGLGCPPGAGRA